MPTIRAVGLDIVADLKDRPEKEIDTRQFPFMPIRTRRHSERRLFVRDGGVCEALSHTTVKAIAVQAGVMVYEDGKQRDDLHILPDASVIKLTQRNAGAIYRAAYLKVAGEEPDETPPWREIPGALMSLLEWEVTLKALPMMRPGDILLIDGAFINTPELGKAAAAIMRTLKEQGVSVVGLSKTCSLTFGDGVPMVPILKPPVEDRKTLRRWRCVAPGIKRFTAPDRTWPCQIHIAKLSRHSPATYRVDTALAGGTTLDEVFGILSAYADETMTGDGYPFPLREIDEAVGIPTGDTEWLRNLLEAVAIEAGMDMEDWAFLFENAHYRILDRNVAK